MNDEGNLIDVSDGSLTLTGKKLDDKLREALILEGHVARLNALASQNLSELEHRNNFKCGLLALESFLNNYQDDIYKEEVKKLRESKLGDVKTEIKKCFCMYDLLKNLIATTPLYRRSENIYSTEE